MKKLQLLLILLFCFAVSLQAQTITTGTVSTNVCPGATISVPYTITGSFTAGNVFTAQLSSSAGAFTSPVAIGTLSSTAAGTISATIPTATAQGSGYRIRVVSSAPVITGSTNVTNITVNALPTAPVITASTTTVCAGSPVTLTAAATENTWAQKTNLGGAARDGAFGFSIGNKGYIGTGSDLVDFWEFDPITNTWTQKANFLDNRSGSTSFSIGDLGYAGLGNASGTSKNDFYCYNPITNTWTRKANFGGAARSYAVGFSIGDKGYVGTGANGPNSHTSDFWEYNPSTDTWLQKANLPVVKNYAVGFSIAGMGYIGTGRGSNALGTFEEFTKSFYQYNPATDTWTQKADFGGQGRFMAIGFDIGNKGYLGTGQGIYNNKLADFWEYNPVSDMWIQKSSVVARQLAVGFSIGENGYIGTGQNQPQYQQNDFWQYTPSQTITWDNGVANGVAFTPTATATYTATASTNVGCTASTSVVVSVNALPTLPANSGGAATVCINATTPAFTNAQAGGTWSIIAGTGTASVSTGGVVTGLTAGTASVKYTYSNGTCSNSVSSSVTVKASTTPTITAGGATYLCSGGSVVLTASAGTSYLWSTGATTQAITVTTTGSYTLLTTGDSSGCPSAPSAAMVVTVSSVPPPNQPEIFWNYNIGSPWIPGPTTTICRGNINLGLGYQPHVNLLATYQYYNPDTYYGTYLWSNGSTSRELENISVSGTYTVQFSNNSGCFGQPSAPMVVTVNEPPSIPTISTGGATTFCSGGSVVLTASAGTTYLWSNGETTQSITVTASGSYSVQVTNSNGCKSVVSAVTVVTVNALPPATITAEGATTNCSGGSVQLTASAGSSYLWNNGASTPLNEVSGARLAVGLRKLKINYNGWALRLRRSSDNQEMNFGFVGFDLDVNAISTWLNGADGYCTVLYDQSGNLGHVKQTVAAAQPLLVLAGINNKPVLRFTTAQTMFNAVNYTAPYSVIYGSRVLGSSARVLGSNFNYWLLGYYAGNMDMAYFNGWVSPESGPGTVLNQYNVYAGTCTGSISTVYKNGVQLFSNAGGLAGPNGIQLNGVGGGTNETSNCEFTDVLIYGSALAAAEIGKLNTSIVDYYSNTYLPVTAANTQTITATTSGSYMVQVADANGCQSYVDAATVVTASTTPTASISGNASFCTGGNTVLTSNATAGSGTISSYQWKVGGVKVSSGGTSATYTATAAGSYTVTVTNSNGCSFTSSAYVVSVIALPTLSANADGAAIVCVNATTAAFTNTQAGGTWSIVAGTGTASVSTGGVVTGLTAGTVSVVYTYSNGTCSNSVSSSLTVNTLTAPISGNTSFCTGENTVLNSNATTGSGTISSYQWQVGGVDVASDGTSATYTATAAGSYTVSVTNSNGCSFTSSAFVVSENANSVSAASSTPALRINTPLTNITHTTTGFTGIDNAGNTGSATGTQSYELPPEVILPTYDVDLGDVTISLNGSIVLNNSTSINSLDGTIGTATGTVGGYSDFTAFGPYTLTRGSTYSFSLSSITTGGSYPNSMAIYIDYNGNGVFTDPGENVYAASSGTVGPHTETGTFTIPTSAVAGLTRMRVICTDELIESPTQQLFFGEYEEYSLNFGTTELPTGLPAGVTASFVANTITISGTPTESGIFNYSIPLTGGCGSANATGTITVNEYYTITASAGTNGSISSPGVSTMSSDGTEDITYTITPDEGYLISDITVDGVSATALTEGSYAVGGTYEFTDVQEDHTISVTFALACDNVGLVAATATSSSICADATTTLTYSGLTGTNALVTWTQFEDGTGTTYGTGTPSSAVGPGTYYAYATGDCGSAISIQVVVGNLLPAPVIEATTNDLAPATIITNSSIALCEGGIVNLTVQGNNTSVPLVPLVPLDQDSGATLAVGLRKLKTAYAGSAIRLRRSSDNQQQDFGFDGNNLNTAAISTWLAGATGFCTTLYDQSGHGGDITQSNTTAQPMYVESGINNKPMLHFNASHSLVNQINYPAPFSVIYGSRVTGQSERALSAQYNNWLLGYWGGFKDQAYFEGWITSPGSDSQSDNAYNIYAASGNGSTSTIYKNGNLLISNGEGLEGPNGIGFNTGENSDFDFTDLMVFGTELSVQNIQKYNNSIGQYYGSGTVAVASNTYQWSTGATTPSVSVSTAGNYTVTVTNNYGCSATSAVTLISNTITASAGTNGSISSPGVTTMSCDGTEDKTYTITPAAGYLISDVTVDDTPATALTTGSYAAGGTYDFTDVQEDHTISVTFALACTNVGLADVTATASSICSNATTTLIYSGLTGTNASVKWTANADGTGTTYGTASPSSPVGPGTYYAYATGDCGSAISIEVKVATTPKTNPTFTQVSAICSGATMVALPPTSVNEIEGIWSPELNNLETTEYTFTPTEGQCANTATMTITVTPATTNGSVTTSICAGDSYTWPLPNGTGLTYTTAQTGLTNVLGCNTATLNLTINNLSITSQPTSQTICKAIGASATISVAVTGATPTYQWYVQTPTGTSWAPLSNNANYAGVTGTTLTITRTTTAVPVTGTKYRVAVSNACVPNGLYSDNVALLEQTVLSKAAAITAKSATNGTLTPALTSCQGNSLNLTLAAGSIGNIQWQSSTDGISYSNVGSSIAQTALSATNAAIPFTTDALTQDTWFRVVASNGVCSSVNGVPIKITVSTPVTTGNINGGGVTVCAPLTTGIDANGIALTTAITNSTLLTLSDYTVGATILWQKSTNYVNSTGATVLWAAAGSTTTTFTASALAADTWYRAKVTNGACVDYTTPVKITVSKTAKAGVTTVTTNGVVTTSVCIGGDITFTSAAYTGTAIQWEVSTTSTTTGFEPVFGATGTSFTMTNVTYAPLSKFYVRSVVTSGDCTLARSAVKTILVNPTSVGGTATGGGTICSGSNGTLKVAGYVGKIQWQSSADGTNYDNVPTGLATAGTNYTSGSATGIGATYLVTAITDDTYFRAKITSGACSEAYSNEVQYTIGTTASLGTLTATNETVCKGSGTTLTLSGSVGTIKWLKSTNWTTATPTWAAVTTLTTGTLATGNLTVSTAYKAEVTIGSCSTETSQVVPVMVFAAPLAKTITANVTSPSGASSALAICASLSKTLTIGVGSIGAIQWQKSTTSSTLGFTDITDAIATSYTITNPTVGANYFRAKFTNSCGVFVYGAAFTLHYKDCAPVAKILSSVIATSTFDVVAYPNPSSTNFNLNITTSSAKNVEVKVYDMIGKLINKMEVSPSKVAGLQIGDRYPSGVYNVTVSQGTEVKTLRVIKQ